MNLLLVDDNVYVLEGLLAGIDYRSLGVDRVYTAKSMQEAVDLLLKETIPLVLTDIEMPNGSGLQLLEWINENRPSTVTIFCTGFADFDYAKRALELHSFGYYLKPIRYDELKQLLGQAVDEVRSRQRIRELFEADSAAKEAEDPAEDAARNEQVLEQVKSYIDLHFCDAVTMEELSASVHFSPSYLAKIFKQKYGISLGAYVIERRMEVAKRLLRESSLPVSEVAVRAGYDNFAYFSRLFRKKTGMTPKEYRRQ